MAMGNTEHGNMRVEHSFLTSVAPAVTLEQCVSHGTSIDVIVLKKRFVAAVKMSNKRHPRTKALRRDAA
jgi:hypothetical protein